MPNEKNDYAQAKKRVENRVGFYIHLAVFVIANAILVAIDLTTSPNKLWFFWPLGGWGIGVALHAAKVFGSGDAAPHWKEKMIEREMTRETH